MISLFDSWIEETLDGMTPIHIAATYGHTAIVKFIASIEDTNPNNPRTDGWTAIHIAAQWGHVKITRPL